MTDLFPTPPATGSSLPASRPSVELRDALGLRRSAGKLTLSTPGPSSDDIDALVAQSTRVPDHRRLGPWRFIIFEGDQRAAFGDAAAQVQALENPQAKPHELDATRGYMLRAPVVVAVISSPKQDKKCTPIWEQELSVGAVCFNLLLSANASGWAGCWLTEWISYSDGINNLLGLVEEERVAGYIYLGTAMTPPQERLRPDPSERTSRWHAPA